MGLITDWKRPVEGGLPVWFYLEDDPLGPFNDAFQPPPPTPVVLDDGQYAGLVPATPAAATACGPTTGFISRGFGCHELYTGIDGTGFGCPPERPWFHNGVDIANSQGTLIWSPVAGTLAYAGPNSTGPDCSDIPGSQPPHEGLGNYQRLSGGDTLHYFGHLSSFLVTSGSVSPGENVAEMGSTGLQYGQPPALDCVSERHPGRPGPVGRTRAKSITGDSMANKKAFPLLESGLPPGLPTGERDDLKRPLPTGLPLAGEGVGAEC